MFDALNTSEVCNIIYLVHSLIDTLDYSIFLRFQMESNAKIFYSLIIVLYFSTLEAKTNFSRDAKSKGNIIFVINKYTKTWFCTWIISFHDLISMFPRYIKCLFCIQQRILIAKTKEFRLRSDHRLLIPDSETITMLMYRRCILKAWVPR